jgi:hypothetical protein
VPDSPESPSEKPRLSIDDLSRPADAKKLARMEELLFTQEDIKRARAQFEESDIHTERPLNALLLRLSLLTNCGLECPPAFLHSLPLLLVFRQLWSTSLNET